MSSEGVTRIPQSVFSCTVTHEGDGIAVDVIGEIDRVSAGQFRNQLLTLAKEHPPALVVDLANATLLDSAGLAVLVEVWRFTQEHGIELTITSPGASIRQVFDVAPSGRLLTLR
jgi:anti-anti-sigma factor